MKKKIIAFIPIIFVALILSSCTVQVEPKTKVTQTEASTVHHKKDVVKSVWITYYELGDMTSKCNTQDEFHKAISDVFKSLSKKGFNTVTVQVHPCADAFYKSSLFPVSKYCFGYQGDKLKYDPLEVMVQAAHKQGLLIEAWFNPYRVSQDNDVNSLSANNIALQWIGDKNDCVYITDTNIYFNPACKEVSELIVTGVKEIVSQYEVDAVHFDDYFYPTSKKDIDKKQYKQYVKSGGTAALADWRRGIVSDMVKSVYACIKSVKPSVRFGISPGGNIDNDYSELYADVKMWCKNKGYVDYICPQIYFGFKNETLPFMKTVKRWNEMAKCCDIYIGLPLYKCSVSDEYAGDRGKSEFKKEHDIISRQINYVNKIESLDGYYIFSYSNLCDEKLAEEVSGVYSAMQ